MIKNNIKSMRLERHLTQRQLADRAGTSQQQIQRLESGVQAARVDLAERVASALGAELHDLFPDIRKIKLRKSRSENDEAEVAAAAGVELDPCLHTFRVRLKGGLMRDLVISARDRSRLRTIALDRDRRGFAVFDTPIERVAINMQAVSFCQFLFDPLFNVEMEDETTERNDDERDHLKVWLVEGGEPLSFGVDYDDRDDDNEELGNLAGLFYDLESASEGEPVSFVDEDGEEAILLSSDVAFCAVPLPFVSQALLDAVADGEEEDCNAE